MPSATDTTTAQTPDHGTSGALAPPPVLFAAALAIGLIVELVVQPPSLPQVPRIIVASVLLLSGLAISLWFIGTFRRVHTPIDLSKPTTSLVTGGPFALTRNPGYVGLAAIYAGLACLLDASWALILLLPTLVLVDRAVIAREERYLERRFGQPYLDYKARVRRWL